MLVFVNGCFDPLHVGHVRMLQWAREQGDSLIVAVAPDFVVARKGPFRPVYEQSARAVIVGALRCVDQVLIAEPQTVLETIRPDIYVKGATQDRHDGDALFAISLGVEIVAAPCFGDESSTSIMRRIRHA